MNLFRKNRPNRIFKRTADIVICGALLPFLLPVILIISGLIKLKSKGPAIYTQIRLGHQGRPFKLYKFRTMVDNADKILDSYLQNDPELAQEWKETHKLHEDPRVTAFGQLLRKTSLDELPQIFNILKGEMTLVGPRPIVNEEIKKYGRYYREYCGLYPGLTGLWQISGRSDTTYERRRACDHYYAHNWSPLLDIKIILKTIPVALKGFGAY